MQSIDTLVNVSGINTGSPSVPSLIFNRDTDNQC